MVQYISARKLLIAVVMTGAFSGLVDCTAMPQESTIGAERPDKLREITLSLGLAALADYGATPWRTPDIQMGESQVNFALDTGTNLFWSTVDTCATTACEAHNRINTSQPDFHFVPNPEYPKQVSFGPWGNMTVNLGSVPLRIESALEVPITIPFDAAIDYSGSKFQYLASGGGIGFPSDTSFDDTNVETLFKVLYFGGFVDQPKFGAVTDEISKSGKFYLGHFNSNLVSIPYNTLKPKKSKHPELGFLWGTNLYSANLGSHTFPALKNSVFYLDTGSSRFKAGSKSIKPILDALLSYKDSHGNPIFETYSDDGASTYTGVKYANGKGPQDFEDILPNFRFAIGDECFGASGATLFSLSPDQYSYKVEVGDRAGEWVAAFHILEGVDGLLVGSTFMDLVGAEFNHTVEASGQLGQGNIILYHKVTGEKPAGAACAPSIHSRNSSQKPEQK